MRRALAAKRREWLDEELIDEADGEDVEQAAKLLAGARCVWAHVFTEDDCVPISEWLPRHTGASRGMRLLVALGLVELHSEDNEGDVLYVLPEG